MPTDDLQPKSYSYYPGLDYAAWPTDWQQLARDLCGPDDGNISSVPVYLRPYIAKDCTPEGWLKCPPDIFNTPLKLARFTLAFDDTAPIPWKGTGATPSGLLAAYDRMMQETAERAQAVADLASDLYFIGSQGGPIKIGLSGDVPQRFKALQAASPVQLELLHVVKGAGQREGEYHQLFAEHRLHGEWFAPHPDILAEIDRLKALAA